MTRASLKRCPPARSSVRGGFTMVEILMVVVIITILIALLLPAINAAFRKAKVGAVSAEISQLSQALADFKSKYGDYPPSRFLAVETGDYSLYLSSNLSLNNTGAVPHPAAADPTSPGEGDITLGQLAQRSVAAIRKFWPRVNTATNQTTTLVYDFNGNGKLDAPYYVLHGHECLVFFLGGIPSLDSSGHFGLNGFDKNPQNPFTNIAASSNRQAPLFEFNPGRLFLDPNSASGIPGYYDSLGNAPPIGGSAPATLNFYAYFSAYGNAGYDPNDVNFAYNLNKLTFETDQTLTNGPIGLTFQTAFPTIKNGTILTICDSYSPNPYTSTLSVGLAVAFQKPQTFQIISSGVDGLYGVGGQYSPTTGIASTSTVPFDPHNTFYGATTGSAISSDADTTIRNREWDNITNFTPGTLQ